MWMPIRIQAPDSVLYVYGRCCNILFQYLLCYNYSMMCKFMLYCIFVCFSLLFLMLSSVDLVDPFHEVKSKRDKRKEVCALGKYSFSLPM